MIKISNSLTFHQILTNGNVCTYNANNQIKLEKCTIIVKKSSELGISIFSSDDIVSGWKED